MAAPRKTKTSALAKPRGRYLRRFTLQNVRTFRSPVTLDFCHPDGKVAQWTVILGENGTGKTTLLQYLAGMMPVQDRELANVLRQKSPSRDTVGFRPAISSEEWIGWHVHNFPLYWSKPMVLTASIEVSSASATLAGATASEFPVPFSFKLVAGADADGRPHIQNTFTGAWDLKFYEQVRVFGYGASRHIAGPASPYLSSDSFFKNGGSSPFSTLFHDDYPLISPEQWLLGLNHAVLAKGANAKTASRAYESARRCLTHALPNLGDVQVAPFGIMPGQTPMTLLCKLPFSPRPLPFSMLSVGYRTMAAWLTDFVKRMHEAFPKEKEPDNGPAVVLIDEFDLHMHPSWQRNAMTALSKEFPNTQFIVTAHSPIMVQAMAGYAKLIVLRRKKRDDELEEVEVVDDPNIAEGWRLDQIVEYLYGMPARTPEYEKLIARRVELRQKPKLTKKEEQELAKLEVRLEQEAPPERAPGSARFFANLQQALDRAEARLKEK